MLRAAQSSGTRHLIAKAFRGLGNDSDTVLRNLLELQPASKWIGTSHASLFSTVATEASSKHLQKSLANRVPTTLPVKGSAVLPPRRNASTFGERVQSAIKAVTSAPASASRRTYDMLPVSARRLVDALSQPSNLQRAVALQLEAAWQRHRRKVLGASLILLAYAVWRTMRTTASAFVDVSNSLAATGLISFGAALSMAAATWLYRRHFVISPAAVYRAAMLRLNTHPGVLEVMGAPVVGSDVRASVLTGGGLKFKGLRPKLRSRRVAMIFPLRGTERRGLVSVEAKKKGGKLKTTLLAVDVPMPAALGGEQRIFIEGGPKAYLRGGVLDELRRPFLAALTSEEAIEAEEDAEDERERHEAEIEEKVAMSFKDVSEKAASTTAAVTERYSRAASAARQFLSKIQQIGKKE